MGEDEDDGGPTFGFTLSHDTARRLVEDLPDLRAERLAWVGVVIDCRLALLPNPQECRGGLDGGADVPDLPCPTQG
jgi:hypothetical protein